MYGLSDVYRGLKNPKRVRGEIRKYCYKVNRRIHSLSPKQGVFVMDEDWDNLIILDGARYDIFDEVSNFENDLAKRTSLGSTSSEFINENFVDHSYHDTVYITANPYYELVENDVFHNVIPLLNKWDNKVQTVLPSDVVSAANEAHSKYPNKRLIIHFMQPHIPFIGEKGQSIRADGWTTGINNEEGISVWNLLMYGHDCNFTQENVISAYFENHEIAIKHANDLSKDLVGKTVLTSDHGNLIGERMSPIPARAYGHMTGLREPGLVNIPWQTLPHDERKKVKSEPPVAEMSKMSDKEREKRLEALGYK